MGRCSSGGAAEAARHRGESRFACAGQALFQVRDPTGFGALRVLGCTVQEYPLRARGSARLSRARPWGGAAPSACRAGRPARQADGRPARQADGKPARQAGGSGQQVPARRGVAASGRQGAALGEQLGWGRGLAAEQGWFGARALLSGRTAAGRMQPAGRGVSSAGRRAPSAARARGREGARARCSSSWACRRSHSRCTLAIYTVGAPSN